MTLRWVEGYTPVSDILKNFATQFTNSGVDTDWQLQYPTTLDEITNLFTLKKTVGVNTVYVEFYQPAKALVREVLGTALVEKDNYFCIEIKFGTGYTAPIDENSQGTFDENVESVKSRLSWFKGNTVTNIRGWLPVHYWMSIDENKIAFVIQGDPAANFDDKIEAFGYIGAIKSFDGAVADIDGNFGVTVGSDISPFDYLDPVVLDKYSDNTGTGVTDITMLKTLTGFPMQAHKIAFTTPDEFIDKKLAGPSAYTQKYHMSPIYVFHGFDGYRGELSGVVATDRSTIVNLDEMIHNDTTNNLKNIYKVFTVDAPYSIFNNSSNVLYAVALLKSSEPLA